ncbi:hypothetical protein COL516b_003698 [Colletotrichum fioriniae]|nr:uncharacterized protein COL516b_003698 [Colletotrichum fioriniae]KAJ0308428.1 hypothetical protein COL516b_003698 [Colletotrichum fioriniae]
MDSTANASWHPAFMPNDASGHATRETQVPWSAETHDSPSAPPFHSQLAEDVEPTPLSQATQLQSQPEEQSSPWLAEHDSQDASDDWPVFERPVSHAPAESDDGPKEPSTSTTAAESESNSFPSTEPANDLAPQPQAVADEPKPSAPTLGHTSTNSFTRTVSHEVNWDDDHDTEWTLSRTDTDPFKFMPPNERTNSFPPVPPASGVSAAVPGTEQPLPSNQAEDLIHEIESAPEHFDNGAFEETNHVANDFENGFDNEEPQDDQHYVGRDATFTEQEDLGSRYEEGVPLIPHSESNGEVSQPEQKLASFGDEVAGEDDFFSQIQNSNNDDFPDFSGNHPLERKSTMQVMGDMNNNTLSRADTLGEMLEEDEDVDEITKSTEEPAEPIQSEDAGAKPADDLAAKWEQAFADDDGEDFLLDESLDEAGESKPVDPSAFFGSDDEGFLDDDDDLPTATAPASVIQSAGQQNRYTPTVASHQASSSPYAPTAPAVPSPYQPQNAATPFAPAVAPYAAQRTQSATPYNAQQTRPEPVKAQSFAAQSKGGYTSPYDLPMEVVVPKKRASTNQLPQSPSTGPSSHTAATKSCYLERLAPYIKSLWAASAGRKARTYASE